MKTPKSCLFFVLLAFAFAGFSPRTAHADASFEYFSESLSPYGEWIETSDYGYVWSPTGVSAEWAPYTDGYWAYTDAGWTWVSYEDFGNITYHYGRWARLGGVGWCWVPGYRWAPAWVSWRSGGNYIGWAPLPPECHFNPGIGISFWVDTTYGIGPGYYNFCRYRDFGAPALGAVIINRNQNVEIINNTTNITNTTVNNTRKIVYNGGPSYQAVARRSARPVQRLKLVQQTDVNAIRAAGGKTLARQQGNQLIVDAPQLQEPTGKVVPPRVARTLEKAEVDHGWSGVKNPRVRQQIEAKMKHDSKGLTPEQAPAKAVTASELNVVSEQPAGAAPSALTGAQGKKGAGGKPLTAPAATGQATGAPDEQTFSATPTPAPQVRNGKKQKATVAARATPAPANVSPDEQGFTAAPTPESRGSKARKAKTVTEPFLAPAEQNATNAAPTPSVEKKARHEQQIAQPNPEQQQLRIERQHQQQLQAEQASQRKLEAQQAARERQLQAQQQRQLQLERAAQVHRSVQQNPQGNPQAAQAATEKGKGKKKDKKDEDQ